MIETTHITLKDFWDISGRDEVRSLSSQEVMMEYDSYMQRLILPRLGCMQMKHISSEDIDHLIKSLMRNVSSRSAIGVRALLRKLFHFAVLHGIRPDNPIQGTTIICQPDREVFKYDYESCIELLRAFRELPLSRLYTFQFLTGLSRCEILGLRAGGIDIRNLSITIDQFGIKDAAGKIRIYRECRSFVPRTITICEVAINVLLEELDDRDLRRRECGRDWCNEYDLVFTNESGGPIGMGALIYSRKKLERICQVPVKNFLSTTNNFALMALQHGVNPADLRVYLGYKSYETIAVMTMSKGNIRWDAEDVYGSEHDNYSRGTEKTGEEPV